MKFVTSLRSYKKNVMECNIIKGGGMVVDCDIKRGGVAIFPIFPLYIPGNIYLFKVNNRNTRKSCEICSKLTIQTPEDVSGVFLLTLNIFHTFL